MTKKILVAALFVATLAPGLALADGPINLALVPSIQIVGETESVTAFRLGIWARNADMTGLDWNIVG